MVWVIFVGSLESGFPEFAPLILVGARGKGARVYV